MNDAVDLDSAEDGTTGDARTRVLLTETLEACGFPREETEPVPMLELLQNIAEHLFVERAQGLFFLVTLLTNMDAYASALERSLAHAESERDKAHNDHELLLELHAKMGADAALIQRDLDRLRSARPFSALYGLLRELDMTDRFLDCLTLGITKRWEFFSRSKELGLSEADARTVARYRRKPGKTETKRSPARTTGKQR